MDAVVLPLLIFQLWRFTVFPETFISSIKEEEGKPMDGEGSARNSSISTL